MPTPPEFLQGTVDILILRTLAWQPMHGYAITRFLRDRSNAEIGVEGAALYQALHRLERKGLITSEWGVSDTNRRARVYSLAKPGRQQLQRETAELRRYFTALFLVLDTP